MQIARLMKLRPAQTSAGLRDPASPASLPGEVAVADVAAAAGRFGGFDRCVGAAAGSGGGAIACVVSGTRGAVVGARGAVVGAPGAAVGATLPDTGVA